MIPSRELILRRIGLIFARISRATSRASTIIFSGRGVIRRLHGKLYFMFQTCELRKHQLVEAHVRMYAMKTETEVNVDDEVDSDETTTKTTR